MKTLTKQLSPKWVEEARRRAVASADSSDPDRRWLAMDLGEALDRLAEYQAADEAIATVLRDSQPLVGSVGFYPNDTFTGYLALKAYETPDGRYLCARGEGETPLAAAVDLMKDREHWLKDPRRHR